MLIKRITCYFRGHTDLESCDFKYYVCQRCKRVKYKKPSTKKQHRNIF